jgi:protein SCO1/2
VDHTGKTVTQADYAGKLLLIYFGYTYCPDVCPTELQIVSQVMDELGGDAEDVQPIFITVDPERDTVEAMASYVDSFHPKLIGLTGSVEQVTKAAKAYRVYYAKVKDEDSSADYLMDHTSFIYLMGRDGQYLAHFPPNSDPEKIAEKVRSFL